MILMHRRTRVSHWTAWSQCPCAQNILSCKLDTTVVVTGPFINFLLHNHFITEFFFKKKSGDANDEANFSFFICFARELNLYSPSYLIPHLRARTQTYTPPLPSPSPPRAR
jgi:hypothetical protein